MSLHDGYLSGVRWDSVLQPPPVLIVKLHCDALLAPAAVVPRSCCPVGEWQWLQTLWELESWLPGVCWKSCTSQQCAVGKPWPTNTLIYYAFRHKHLPVTVCC